MYPRMLLVRQPCRCLQRHCYTPTLHPMQARPRCALLLSLRHLQVHPQRRQEIERATRAAKRQANSRYYSLNACIIIITVTVVLMHTNALALFRSYSFAHKPPFAHRHVAGDWQHLNLHRMQCMCCAFVVYHCMMWQRFKLFRSYY